MNRRNFLQATAAATVGFAASGLNAAETLGTKQIGLVDTNVTLGRWPLRRLPFDDTNVLAAKLRKHGVTQAWVGNFGAVFTQDLGATNAWLAAECRKRGRGLFVPFVTVNPALPGWETELRRCREEHKIPGVRLFPNYHGYKLNSPEFGKFLAVAAAHKILVQIAVSIEDERTQPTTARTPHVDVKSLLSLLKSAPVPRVMLLNWQRGVSLAQAKQLAELGVGFDIATVENVGGVAKLVEEISAGRVLFGSHAPFFYFESAQLKLKEAALSGETERAVCFVNARRQLG